MRNSNSPILFVTSILILMAMALACSETKQDGPAPANDKTTKPETTVAAKDISGSYSVTGTNVDGAGDYKADLVVTNRDDVYQFSWLTAGKRHEGVGVQTDDTVAVAFTDKDDGTGCGVVLYEIAENGDLSGKAGYWGVNSVEIETGKRTSGTDLEGKYEVTGKNPKGDSYKGTLDVKKDGDGYSFTWNTGGTATGFGIRMGDKVTAGIGGNQCGFVMYELKDDGSLEGKWGGQGSKRFGTETAKKN